MSRRTSLRRVAGAFGFPTITRGAAALLLALIAGGPVAVLAA
jgi:hypothetical protein